MNDDGRRGVLLRMPCELRRAIVAEVRSSGTNLNDVAVEAIARHYHMPFAPSGRRSDPRPENAAVLLRMSDELKYTIQCDALQRRSNMTDTLIRILATEFNVRVDRSNGGRTTPFGGGRGGIVARMTQPRTPALYDQS